MAVRVPQYRYIVTSKIFESGTEPWETLCKRATDFATNIPPDALIGISHSESRHGNGVVIVWYRLMAER